MNRRRAFLIAAAGLVLVVGGLVLAAVLIPVERVAGALAERAEAALGHPVAIERVGVSILPLPGVRLSGLTVGPDDSTALARLDRVELRVRILPLLSGRVVVRSLDLDRPRIVVEIDEGGATNFPVFEPDTSAEPSPGSARDIVFAVDRIRVSDGAIRYRNAGDGTRVDLDGWSQQLAVSGTVAQGELAALALSGWLEIGRVTAELPGAVLPARDLSVRVRHDAVLDLAADRLELRDLEVGFDGVTLGGSGTVVGVNSGRPDLRLDLAADGLDAGRLMAWVPDSLRARMALPDGRTVGLRGSASIRAAVTGTVAPGALPTVDGMLSLAGVAVTLGSAPVLEDVGGQAHFSLDTVVARFDGRALGERFNAGVALRDPGTPTAVLAFSGGGDLGRLVELGLAPDTLGLDGAVRVDLRAQLPVRDLAAARAVGTIEATGIALAGLDPAVRVPAATARFEGGRVRLRPLRVELGPDPARLDFDIGVEGWIPAAVDTAAPPPTVTVALDAGTLDLDALLGVEPEPGEGGYAPLLFARLRDRPIDGRSAAELAQEMGFGVPALPRADARLDARVVEVVKNGIHYSDMDLAARMTPEGLTLDRLRFGLMGGVVDAGGEVRIDATDGAGVPVETGVVGRFALRNVGAGPFFDLLTPFRDHLSGRMDMAGTVRMTVDRHGLPERSSVGADGTLAIADGRLANWAVLRSLTDRLGIARFDTLRFNDWAGRFRVDGPTVALNETALAGADLHVRAAGWFDFGGQLDVRGTAALAPELAGRAGAIGAQLVADDGQVPVGIRIHGNVEDPDVALDLGPARDALSGRARAAVDDAARRAETAAREAERQVRDAAEETRGRAEHEARDAAGDVRDRAEEQVRDAADRATRKAADRFELPDSLRELPADSLRQLLGDSLYALLPDSVRLRADSLQQAIENAIRERLRRLLPGGGGDGG